MKDKGNLIRCPSCEKEKVEKEFIKYHSELSNTGRLPLCRKCIKERFVKLKELHNNTFMALFHLCMNFNFPFDYRYAREVIDERISAECVVKYFSDMSAKMGLSPSGTTISKELVENIKDMNEDVDTSYIKINDEDDNIKLTQEVYNRWGRHREKEDIYFLESLYSELVESYGASLPTEKNLYRDYAIGELNTRKAEENGQNDLYMKLRKSQSALMADAKLKPSKLNTLEKDEQLIGMIARMIEDERPVAEVSDRFKDVDGIKKIIDEEYTGQLINSIGLFK